MVNFHFSSILLANLRSTGNTNGEIQITGGN